MIFPDFKINILLKWIIVSILLLISKGALLFLIPFFIYKYYKNIYNRSDLFFLYFLSFLLQSLSLGVFGLARYVIVGFILFDLFIYKRKLIIGPDKLLNGLLFLFFILIFINSIFISPFENYSLLSLLQFIPLILLTYIFSNFKFFNDFKSYFDNYFNLSIALLLLSILSLFIPSISFSRNGVGFQGVLNHPNTYGVYFSAVTGLFLILFMYKKKIVNLLLFLISISCLFLSQSRTSILSLLLGVFIYSIFIRKFRVVLFKRSLLILPILTLLFVFNMENIKNFTVNFLAKGGDDITESVNASRGKLIEDQVLNINENFLLGIGFKVPSDMKFHYLENGDTKYEKGNSFLGATEEIGVLGFILMMILLCILLFTRNLYNNVYAIIPMILFFSLSGEASLFSIGGLGNLLWYSFFLNRKLIKSNENINNSISL